MKRWDLVATVLASAALPLACTPTPTEGPAQQSCFYEGEKREAGSSCECDNGTSGVVACPVPGEGTEPECRCPPADTPDGAADASTDITDTVPSGPDTSDDRDTTPVDTDEPEDTAGRDTADRDADTGANDTDGGGGLFDHPGPGELVITEFMANPEALSDNEGEWFEIYNPNDTESYELDYCTVGGTGANNAQVDGELTVGPEEYVTLGRSNSPGFGTAPDYVYGGEFQLDNNGAGRIRIECGETLVDEMSYGGVNNPQPTPGAARGLDPTKLDASANDDVANWCDQTSDQGNGDKGTPGAENDPCS